MFGIIGKLVDFPEAELRSGRNVDRALSLHARLREP